MFCGKCGNELGNNDSFCGKCGFPVKNGEIYHEPKSVSQEAVRAKESQNKNKLGKCAVNALAVLVIVGLSLAIVFYVGYWLRIFNDPTYTVHGWWSVFVKGALQILLLMMISSVIVMRTDLLKSKLVRTIWCYILLQRLSAICTTIYLIWNRMIRHREFVENGNKWFGYEEMMRKMCFGVLNSVLISCTFLLVPYIVKKKKAVLSRVLAGIWIVLSVVGIGSFWGSEMRMLRMNEPMTYLSNSQATLFSASTYLFLAWLLIKLNQQAKMQV